MQGFRLAAISDVEKTKLRRKCWRTDERMNDRTDGQKFGLLLIAGCDKNKGADQLRSYCEADLHH